MKHEQEGLSIGASSRGRPANRGRQVVVVVDDGPELLDAVCAELEDHFEIRRAADCPTALKLIRSASIDAVVLDIVMPNADGLQALTRLRDEQRSLPVIVLTGLDRAVATEAMRRGAEDCITKPTATGALVSALISAMQASGVFREGAGNAPNGTRCESARSLLLVGRDVPLLATLKAVLRTGDATQIASSPTSAFEHCGRFRPSVCIVDDSMEWNQVVHVANTLRHIAPDCAIGIGYAPDRNAGRVGELAPLQLAGLMAKPYDFNELQKWAEAWLRESQIAAGARWLSAPVLRAMEYVAQHYQGVTLDAAAKAAAVSVGYLAHLFPAELGITFWRHVTNVRLELVRDLLAETDYKLGHVAQLAGFSDGPHLWRVFHRHCAQRPGDYRRMIAERRQKPSAKRHQLVRRSELAAR